MNTNKQELVSILQNNVMSVQFKKVASDDIRTMRCTLRSDLIPMLKTEEQKMDATVVVHENKRVQDNIVHVYDLEKNGWRCFHLDNVIRANTV